MAARRTERLLNLVICLLSTRRYLSAHRIRELVPGYGPEDDEAFRRMFERDKEELRDLGIPLEVGSDSAWDDEPGYRIARRDYELPEISLTADEAAAVGLAGRLWQQAGLADAASRAMLKLRAAGIDADAGSLTGLEPRFDAPEAAFEPLLAAVRDGQAVGFDYRGAGAATPTHRLLDAWGVVSWHGRWYVVGHDRDRGAERVFRLSRVVGTVEPLGPLRVPPPPGVDLRAFIAAFETDPPVRRTATVRVRHGAAYQLRRTALADPTDTATAATGWDVLTIGYAAAGRLAEQLAGYGADVVALEPPEVRDALVARLTAVAAATVSATSAGGRP